MRILIATRYRAIVGGAETYLRVVIPALAARGYQVGLLHELDASHGVETIDGLGDHVEGWCTGNGGTDAALASAAAWGPSVVYAHGLLSSDLEAALLERWPAVLFAHGYYGTCGTGLKRHTRPDIRACGRVLAPACLVLNYTRGCGIRDPFALARTYALQTRRNVLLQEYRAVLVGSEHMRSEYARHNVAADRLHLVPMPVTEERDDVAVPDEHPPTGRILFVGRLTELKGAHYLLEAVALARRRLEEPLSVTIAGDGPYRSELEARANGLGVAARFVGWAGAAQRGELMREADLLAVPSLWPEPFALVGVEAAEVGVPSVGFDIGGIPEWLIPGRSGELAPADPPTASGLADAIVRAMDDPVHYAHLRRGALAETRRFTARAHIGALESIFDRVAGNVREETASFPPSSRAAPTL
ncbi:MAG: glycosyltransferase family 4 protein [Gemmatimonadaceae bacterium]